MQKNKGFTLIELLIVVAIIAVLAGLVIFAIEPGERLKDAREAARESHMGSIAEAIYGAVVDCTDANIAANYCGTVAEVLTTCLTTWQFTPGATNCTITMAAPKDPSSGDNYYVRPTLLDGRINIWAPSDESVWKCTWATTQCTGATYKVY